MARTDCRGAALQANGLTAVIRTWTNFQVAACPFR